MKERRRFKRFSISKSAYLKRNNTLYKIIIDNISKGGVCIKHTKLFNKSSAFSLVLNSKEEIDMEIVWNRKINNSHNSKIKFSGFKFINIDTYLQNLVLLEFLFLS